MNRTIRAIAATLLLGLGANPSPLAAKSLDDALASTFPAALREDGEGLAEVFARSVAASFPVTGTSASFAYEFDPATDSFRRKPLPLGPVFSERADPVGARKLSLGINYLYAAYDSIEGHDLDELVSNSPNGSAAYVAVCAWDLCEPVQAVAHLDLEAQILALSGTYGLTPDLDFSIFLPLVRTFLRGSTTFVGPDPRVAPQPDFFLFQYAKHATATNEGIGDLMLRLRYRLLRHPLADVAAGLTLSLPTGSQASFHGTGHTLVNTALYASRTFAGRVQPHINTGFVFNADDIERSQARYSAGFDLLVFDWLTLNNDFLGRSDVAQAHEIDRPVFVQIERADTLQFSTGLKVAPFQRTAVLFFNVLLPLNNDGLRADAVFASGVEVVF
jgi:hypothetical protein